MLNKKSFFFRNYRFVTLGTSEVSKSYLVKE